MVLICLFLWADVASENWRLGCLGLADMTAVVAGVVDGDLDEKRREAKLRKDVLE